MNLKKRAAGAIAIAMSVVVMTSVAQAAPVVPQTSVAVETTKTDLATNGIAGIAVSMNQYEAEAYQYIEMASANVAQTDTVRVASGDAQETTDGEQTEEETLWQNRLMADVNEFLYVRAQADENAEIVGKLYKGDVAEIEEAGDGWTHIKSGNVDGYVSNAYCLTGTDALNYAKENFDTEATVLADGLRVRSDAGEDASIVTAVAEGTVLKVEDDADTDAEWIAVSYNGETRYVNADYVSTELSLGEGITMEEEQAEQERIAKEEAEKQASQVTEVTTVQNAAVEASVDEVTLLAAIIQCEAGNEVYEGQLAVGAVVMNRVRSGAYPGTVHDVIYQKSQFPPAAAGTVASIAANGPKQSCIQAAQEALNGTDNTAGATCFKRASSGHAGVVIGNHVFY